MKINLNFYKEDIIYNQLAREQYIIQNYINQYKETQYEDIIKKDNNIETISMLSEIRKNIINWYPFKKDSNILEIGAGVGEITGELCKKAHKVTSIEFSKERGQAIAKRHEDKENLEIIIGNLKDIKINEKFDYITLIGILEYAPKIYKSQEPITDLLKYVKALLKEDGKILIATNNKFAMRNWCVINENDRDIEYNAISKIGKTDEDCQLISKNELEEVFYKVQLGQTKYYYPLPDYKYTNVIFTKQFMPDQDNLHRNMTFFKDTEVINFHENDGYLQVIKEDKRLFEFFTNSYFIEIANNLEENQIKYVSFWNNRKQQYRLRTIIQGDKVYKYPNNDLSKQHINMIKQNIDILRNSGINTLDTYDEEKIISKYALNAKSYNKVLIEEYKANGIEKLIQLVDEFTQKTIMKLELADAENNIFDNLKIQYEKDEIKNLHFIKEGLWDLNFQNCFLIDGEFYIYDQEWIESKVPIEFIVYRELLIFEELKKLVNIDEIYEKLGILQYKELFNKLEKIISEKIMDDKICEAWQKPMKTVRGLIVENHTLRTTNQSIQIQLQQLQEENQRNIEQIKAEQNNIQKNLQLIQQKDEKIQELTQIVTSSLSWKISRAIKKITGQRKDGGNK